MRVCVGACAPEHIQICTLRCVRICENKMKKKKSNRLRNFAFDRTSLHQMPHIFDMAKGMRNTRVIIGAAAATVNHLICIPFVYQLLSTAYSTFIYFSFSSRSPVRHIFISVSYFILYTFVLCLHNKIQRHAHRQRDQKKERNNFYVYINV